MNWRFYQPAFNRWINSAEAYWQRSLKNVSKMQTQANKASHTIVILHRLFSGQWEAHLTCFNMSGYGFAM
jgi:hypothetical protein